MYFMMKPVFCPLTHRYCGMQRTGKPIKDGSVVAKLLKRLAKKFSGPQVPYAVDEHNVIVAYPPTPSIPDGFFAKEQTYEAA